MDAVIYDALIVGVFSFFFLYIQSMLGSANEMQFFSFMRCVHANA
jgi:hypothetical protein